MTAFLRLFIWAGLCIGLLVPLGAHAVKKDNLYLFSAVKGRIVKDGKPVALIKVERSTFWNMEKEPRIETTFTDEQGFYEFPEMIGSAEFGWLHRLLHQPTVTQEIFAHQEANEILLYVNIKSNYESPENDQGLRLLSDLSNMTLILGRDFEVKSEILANGESF